MPLVAALTLLLLAPSNANAAPCDTLIKLQLANTTITSARIVSPGAFHLPPRRRGSVEFFTAFNRLPAFCRVEAIVSPSQDSHIEVEVWLPATAWNGKFLGVGNGGFAGSLHVTPSGKKHVAAETLSAVVALHAPAAPVIFELTRETPGAIFSAASRIFW